MKYLPAILAVLALVAGGSANAETVERSAPADPRGTVEIGNVAGSVRVEGWDRAEVHVEARLGSGVERLEFASRGARTRVEVIHRRGRGGTADLVIRVPRDSTLSVKTVSADQGIEGVRGTQRLQAVSGSIDTQVWSEDLEARTVSGEISARGQGNAGVATVTTVSGGIRLTEIAGEVVLQTVNGEMELEMRELTRGRIRSTNGDLTLLAALAPDARIDAEAVNGDMDFQFHGTVDVEFDIETFNGDIENCFGRQAVRTREFGPGLALRFTQGEGRGRVRVKTLNGAVEVCAR